MKAAKSIPFHLEDWTQQYRETMNNAFCQTSRYFKSLRFLLETWTFPSSFPSLETIFTSNWMKSFVAARTKTDFFTNQLCRIDSFFSFMSLICRRSCSKFSYWHKGSLKLILLKPNRKIEFNRWNGEWEITEKNQQTKSSISGSSIRVSLMIV